MEHSSKHVLVLQHCDCEELGTIADVLKRASVTPHYIRSFDGQSVPKETADAVGLIIMGGPQSVYEQDTFLHIRDEISLIENALMHEKPVLGEPTSRRHARRNGLPEEDKGNQEEQSYPYRIRP